MSDWIYGLNFINNVNRYLEEAKYFPQQVITLTAPTVEPLKLKSEDKLFLKVRFDIKE